MYKPQPTMPYGPRNPPPQWQDDEPPGPPRNMYLPQFPTHRKESPIRHSPSPSEPHPQDFQGYHPPPRSHLGTIPGGPGEGGASGWPQHTRQLPPAPLHIPQSHMTPPYGGSSPQPPHPPYGRQPMPRPPAAAKPGQGQAEDGIQMPPRPIPRMPSLPQGHRLPTIQHDPNPSRISPLRPPILPPPRPQLRQTLPQHTDTGRENVPQRGRNSPSQYIDQWGHQTQQIGPMGVPHPSQGMGTGVIYPPPHLGPRFGAPRMAPLPTIPNVNGMAPAAPERNTEMLPLLGGESIQLNDLYKSLLNEEYFHPVDRNYVPKIITQDGMFIIRPSKKENQPLTLSFMKGGRLYHVPIRKRPDNKYALGSAKTNEMAFNSVQDLKVHYHLEPIVLEDGSTFRLLISAPK